jgi:hypothetical protein
MVMKMRAEKQQYAARGQAGAWKSSDQLCMAARACVRAGRPDKLKHHGGLDMVLE